MGRGPAVHLLTFIIIRTELLNAQLTGHLNGSASFGGRTFCSHIACETQMCNLFHLNWMLCNTKECAIDSIHYTHCKQIERIRKLRIHFVAHHYEQILNGINCQSARKTRNINMETSPGIDSWILLCSDPFPLLVFACLLRSHSTKAMVCDGYQSINVGLE